MASLFPERIRNSRGAALVEFALVMGLLIFLLMGAVEFSLIMKDYLAVGEAAAQGALVASRGESYSTVYQAAVTALPARTPYDEVKVTYGPSTGKETLWPNTASQNPAGTGDKMVVSVTFYHKLVTGMFDWLGEDGYMQLRQEGVNMRSATVLPEGGS
ncbi:MAG: pilus assembly protein [Armatimonadetes bacterium]|nr:pilus assembly protein [Armatimonadota bacterium]